MLLRALLTIPMLLILEEESFSEDGQTELAIPGENGERQMKPVRMLKFSGNL